MLIPQYQVLVLKLSPIYTVSLNMVFSIPQNQCYLGTPCLKWCLMWICKRDKQQVVLLFFFLCKEFFFNYFCWFPTLQLFLARVSQLGGLEHRAVGMSQNLVGTSLCDLVGMICSSSLTDEELGLALSAQNLSGTRRPPLPQVFKRSDGSEASFIVFLLFYRLDFLLV